MSEQRAKKRKKKSFDFKYYINTPVIAMDDREDFDERGLNTSRLSKYSELLGGAIDAFESALYAGVFVAPAEEEKSIRFQMERLLGYCLRHRTCRALWLEDLSSSGVVYELGRVINLIPVGYSLDNPDTWGVIHCIVRIFLTESDFENYNEELVGYSSGNSHLWGRLFKTSFVEEYPPSSLPAKFNEKMSFFQRWNDHLEFKEEYGTLYRREYDPYYEGKLALYIKYVNPNHEEDRSARSVAHEEWLIGLNSAQREEASEDYSSEDPLSSDADHEMSSEDSDLD